MMKMHVWNPGLKLLPRDGLDKIKLQRLKEVVHRVYNNQQYRKKMKEKGLKPEDIKNYHSQQKKR